MGVQQEISTNLFYRSRIRAYIESRRVVVTCRYQSGLMNRGSVTVSLVLEIVIPADWRKSKRINALLGITESYTKDRRND